MNHKVDEDLKNSGWNMIYTPDPIAIAEQYMNQLRAGNYFYSW